MPGSSLWLVPLPNSWLYNALNSLINTDIPDIYPEAAQPSFTPHVTLTADTIPSDLQDPQEWLDTVKLPTFGTEKLTMRIGEPVIGSIYFQKLTLAVEKNRQICELAIACRAASTNDEAQSRRWVGEQYWPHCSLMYSDMPPEAVKANLSQLRLRIVAAQQLKSVEEDGHSGASSDHITQDAEIWLVPTGQPVSKWKPIAVRQLEGVQWYWRGLRTDSSSS